MLDARHLITKVIGSFILLWVSFQDAVRSNNILNGTSATTVYSVMPSLRNPELFPVAIIGIITLVAVIVFWSVMDMVLLGASLAIVLMPLHHRLVVGSSQLSLQR